MNLNINFAEVNKFNNLANSWWDLSGSAKVLHAINKPRMEFITNHIKLANKTVLDVGCGGGILAETLCKAQAKVTGVDAAEDMIAIAKQHAANSKLTIQYQVNTVEEICALQPSTYDIITCMELLEHVPNFNSIIKACRSLLKPGGSLFLSTLNRTTKAFLLAVVGAEYLLKLLPKHTHDYQQFIKPAELMSSLQSNNFDLHELQGITYNPFSNTATLTTDVSVNYIAYAIAR